MSKKVLGILILSMTVLSLAACGSAKSTATNPAASANNTPSTNNKDYAIKFAHVSAPDSHYQAGAEKFKEIVEKKSDGKIKVTIYPGSQLGAEKELATALQANTVQAAIIAGTLPIIDPKFAVLDVIFKDYKDAHNKLSGELGKKLFDLLPSKGLHGIAWTENGFRAITNSKRPIHTPDDLKGLKIRTPENKAYIETFAKLGANPSPLPFSELFTALEQKVVDGQENPIPQIYTNKFQEVQKYMSITNHLYGPAPILMSKKFYDNLPDDLKKIVDEAGNEATQYQWGVVEKMEKEMLEDIKKQGMTVNLDVDVDKFKKQTEPVYTMFEPIVGKDLLDLAKK